MAIWRGARKHSRWSGPASKGGFPKRVRPRGGGRTDSPMGRSRNPSCLHQPHRVEDKREGPPLVDEDWHVVRPSTWASRERSGRTCTASLWRCTTRSTSAAQRSNMAKMLWNKSEARGRGDENYDPTSEQDIISRDAVRRELRTKHLQSPVMALTEAL